jgi:hypothetical protein
MNEQHELAIIQKLEQLIENTAIEIDELFLIRFNFIPHKKWENSFKEFAEEVLKNTLKNI